MHGMELRRENITPIISRKLPFVNFRERPARSDHDRHQLLCSRVRLAHLFSNRTSKIYLPRTCSAFDDSRRTYGRFSSADIFDTGRRPAHTWRFVSQRAVRLAILSLIGRREIIRRLSWQAEPVWHNGRAYDSGPRGPGFDTHRLGQMFFPLGEEINRHC